MLRARRTAEILWPATNGPVRVEDDLREIDFGLWEGKTFQEVAAGWPAEVNCWAAFAAGVNVVRLHTGEPSIYGAIGEQMDALDRLGIEYQIVPGISAFQAAAAALRTELTAPEVSQTVILTRTAGRTPVPPSEELGRLAASQATLCIFLSTGKIAKLVETLAPHYGRDCPAAAVYHASWPDQKVVRATLADIAARTEAEGITRTAILLVGRALERPLPHTSKLYDKDFGHGYREGTTK